MPAIHTLALTDDEAAAIAVRSSGAWRTPLPTVDETSEAELASAVLRGRRSLVVRDLAKPDGTAIGEAARVLAALGSGPRAMFVLVDAQDEWVPGGLTIYLYGPSPGQADMSHVVASAGVHYFRVQPPPDQWRALTELAEAVFEGGFTEADEGVQQPAAAVLSVAREAELRSIRVTQGEVSVARSQDPVKASTFATVADAVSWITK